MNKGFINSKWPPHTAWLSFLSSIIYIFNYSSKVFKKYRDSAQSCFLPHLLFHEGNNSAQENPYWNKYILPQGHWSSV